MSEPESSAVTHPAYRREDNFMLVEVTLHDVRQLFHTLDPAPFRQKDLDSDAEEYIVEALQEIGRRHPVKLVFYLPAELLGSEGARTLPAAVKNYFSYRAAQSARKLRRVLRTGFASVVVGTLFLGLCLSLRQLAQHSWSGTGGTIIGEGLLIVGWIALWRPLEIFLYDWWPIRQEQTLYQWITRQNIEVRRR